MTTNIMLTVGIGPNDTVVMGVISDGNIICNIGMSKQQVLDHIAVLQRHVDLLPTQRVPVASHIN